MGLLLNESHYSTLSTMLDSTTGIAPSTREAVIKVAYRLLHHVQSAMLTYEMTNSMNLITALSVLC